MSSQTPEKWRSLTRRELSFLDSQGLDLVMAAQGLGAECRVSTNNHVIIRARSGETMSISRNLASGNRASQNAHAQFKRLFGMSIDKAKSQIMTRVREERQAILEAEQAKAEQIHQQATQEAQAKAEQAGFARTSAALSYACTCEGCDEVFPTADLRMEHMVDLHSVCKHEGCIASFTKPQGSSAHYRLVHLGERPRLGTGKKQKHHREDVPQVPIEPEEEEKEPVSATETTQPTEPDVEESLDALETQMNREDYAVVKKPTTFDELITAIRALLPEAPSKREQELETELDEVKIQLGEMQAKIDLLRETLGL